jgi:hypothetical protein
MVVVPPTKESSCLDSRINHPTSLIYLNVMCAIGAKISRMSKVGSIERPVSAAHAALGHKQTLADARVMSALPPKGQA